MALMRIEVQLSGSGYFFAELYYPHDGLEPIATTKPIFKTHAEATNQALQCIIAAFKQTGQPSDLLPLPQSPSRDDPT